MIYSSCNLILNLHCVFNSGVMVDLWPVQCDVSAHPVGLPVYHTVPCTHSFTAKRNGVCGNWHRDREKTAAVYVHTSDAGFFQVMTATDKSLYNNI